MTLFNVAVGSRNGTHRVDNFFFTASEHIEMGREILDDLLGQHQSHSAVKPLIGFYTPLWTQQYPLNLKAHWRHFREEQPSVLWEQYSMLPWVKGEASVLKKSVSSPTERNSRGVISTGIHRKHKVSIGVMILMSSQINREARKTS